MLKHLLLFIYNKYISVVNIKDKIYSLKNQS